ncbi:MAG TPA: helicase C-terminal domain-containing protein [Lacunisphaera sp.]|nr:helicase C-terminal domain-containing protein [Lacunisphaera sp.]
MEFSLDQRTAWLSAGEFAGFALGPREPAGGAAGLWRAQLGQHWHNELRAKTEREFTVEGALRPDVQFEVAIEGKLVHRGWTFHLNGRIDQLIGATLREIKTVTRPLPAEEAELRADYPEYFLQLATYAVLSRSSATRSPLLAAPKPREGGAASRSELVFVEAGSGLSQTIVLTPFDEALVHHQLDAVVEFLNLQLRARERRRSLHYRPPFPQLRPGQETIQADLAGAFDVESPTSNDDSQPRIADRQLSTFDPRPSTVLLFEAPTGYGKTGCVLEFALGRLRAGRFARLIWLTGKATGQLQVVSTLRSMTTSNLPLGTSPLPPSATSVAAWQIRNKAEHCVNHTFHCVRDGCEYLRGCTERWPASGLAKFYLDENQPHDLDTLRAAGREALICPYEITRTALAFNDVWIGDFNYVFAPDNRGLLFDQPGFDPAQTLLVVDEAHNLPSRVAGAHSHRATETDARLLLAELDHLRAPASLVLAAEEWARLLGALKPTESLEPVLEHEIHDLLARLAELVLTQQVDYVALGPQHSATLWQFPALLQFMGDQELKKLLWVAKAGELEFTCVDAAAAIGATLKEFGGAILMSATLQPFDEMAVACGFEVGRGVPSAPLPPGGQGTARPTVSALTAPTPWRVGAYDVAVDLRVDTSFKQRATHYGTTAATVEALAAAAAQAVERRESQVESHADIGSPSLSTFDFGLSTHKAVAVFFPSYAYAEAVLRALENSGSVLRVALQPKLPDLAAQAAWVEESLALVDALFLVLGSSFAEGIDLLGGRVTHAMVVGPALPEVNAVQKARMDAFASLGRDAAFRRVYQIPGLQKVNQALGRLVRAPGQKAKVLLHCRRFADPTYSSLLAADYQFYREIATDDDLAAWLDGSPAGSR